MQNLCRIFVVFALTGLLANVLAAEPVSNAMKSCANIVEDKDRLSCFDQIVASMNEAPTVSPAENPAPMAALPEPVQPEDVATVATSEPTPAPQAEPASRSTEIEFGLENVRGSRATKSMTARVMNDFSGWDGDTVFELDNGQVWVQAESGRMNYRGSDNPEVTIRRKAFGAFRLSVEGSNKTIRVKRRR